MVVGTVISHDHSTASTPHHGCKVTELVRFLKNNFAVEKGNGHKCEKVLTRSSQTLIPEYDEDSWKKHFERRQKHLHHGFFTECYKPYHPVGSIALDTNNLVLDVYKHHLPEKPKLPGITHDASKKTTQDQVESPTPAFLQDLPVKSEGSQTNTKDPVLASAGFYHIKRQLEDFQQILTAVKGDQSFDKCVKQIEEVNRNSEDSIQNYLSSWSAPALPLTKRRFSRFGITRKQCEPVKSAMSMRLILTPSPAVLNDDSPEHMDIMQLAFYRSCKMLLRKLEAIYLLLCGIHNMKSRDLRGKGPISHEAIKTLMKKDVLLDHNGRPAISRRNRLTNTAHTHHHIDPVHSTDNLSPHGHHGHQHHVTLIPPHSAMHGNKGGHSKHHLHHPSGTNMGHHSSMRAVTPTQIWRSRFKSTFGSRLKDKHERDHNKIETWEDLLHAGPSEKHGCIQHRQSVLSNPHNPHSRHHAGFLHLVSHYRSYRRPDPHHHHHEKLPYWLGEGVTIPEKVKKTHQPSQHGQGSPPSNNHGEGQSNTDDSDDIENPVDGLRTEFDKVQSKMTKDVLTDLERMERERCKSFIQKFMALRLSPLFERELREMRKATIQNSGQDLEFDVKPSKWYIDLKTECDHLVGSHDNEIKAVMRKLSKFSFEDAKSIPNGKERLCLLVMSLAADELMTIHMQKAIQFVLENILNDPTEFLVNWLAHRKMPVVINIHAK